MLMNAFLEFGAMVSCSEPNDQSMSDGWLAVEILHTKESLKLSKSPAWILILLV